MKALTLWPEWAWAIMRLNKRVENRCWHPPMSLLGEMFAIHAGAHIGGRPGRVATEEGVDAVVHMAEKAGWMCKYRPLDDVPLRFVSRDFFSYPDPIDMYINPSFMDKGFFVHTRAIVGVARLEKVENWDSPLWSVPGQVHWHLTDVVSFSNIIPASGKQKLWELTPFQRDAVCRELNNCRR